MGPWFAIMGSRQEKAGVPVMHTCASETGCRGVCFETRRTRGRTENDEEILKVRSSIA